MKNLKDYHYLIITKILIFLNYLLKLEKQKIIKELQIFHLYFKLIPQNLNNIKVKDH